MTAGFRDGARTDGAASRVILPEDPTDRGPLHGGATGAPPIRLGDRWPFLLLSLALLALGLSFWRPVPAGVWHDDGVYLIIGKALAEGGGLRYAGVPGDVPAVKFPPLYPSLLAGFWLVFGAVRPVMLAAVFLNLALLAAAGTLLAIAVHRSLGVSRRTSVLLGGLALVSADVWRLALVPLSEPLFIALMAGALASWTAASRPDRRHGAVMLAVTLSLAVLTRSAGLALVVGFALALALARGARSAAVVVAAPLFLTLAWGGWASAQARQIPEALRDVLGPYGGWLAAQALGAPVDFLRALPGHTVVILQRVFALLLPGLEGAVLALAAVPISAFVVWGLVLLRRRFPPLTWVVVAYLGMLLFWPFVDRRLVAPLHPLLVVAAGTAMLEAWQRSTRQAVRGSVVGLALLWVGTLTTVAAWRASSGWAAAPYQLRAGRLAAAVEALERTAPPGAVVGAPEFWAGLHLHGGWAAMPSALFSPRSEDDEVPVWGAPEDQLALWWGAGVDHLLLEQGGRIHGDALNLIEERCPGEVGVLATMPPQMLVRLEWDESCAAALGLGPADRGR